MPMNMKKILSSETLGRSQREVKNDLPPLRHFFKPVLDTVPRDSVPGDVQYPCLSWSELFKAPLAPTKAKIKQHPVNTQGTCGTGS